MSGAAGAQAGRDAAIALRKEAEVALQRARSRHKLAASRLSLSLQSVPDSRQGSFSHDNASEEHALTVAGDRKDSLGSVTWEEREELREAARVSLHHRVKGTLGSSDSDVDGGVESADGGASGSEQQSQRKKKAKRLKDHKKRPWVKVAVHTLNQMGEIVDPKGHPARESASVFQLGLRTCVGMNTAKPPSDFHFETFQEFVKMHFPKSGSSMTPPHPGPAFKFKDYCPTVFRRLRDLFHIDTAHYLIALTNTLDDGTNALRIMGTPGKSGSLFFFSHDMRYIVKTLPKREARVLRDILPNYYQHVLQNPGTLLPHFYGLHRIKPEYGRNVRFVVMNNVFATAKPIHLRFDLKGSTLGRRASERERSKGSKAILKDLDLLDKGVKIRVGPQKAEALMAQIRSDCHLLMSLKLMDYSLLMGVHSPGSDCPDPHSPASLNNLVTFASKMRTGDDSGSATAAELPDINVGDDSSTTMMQGSDGEQYFIGIIDILMTYTARKQAERVYKTVTGGEGVSSQPPPKYGRRFCSFIKSITE